MATPQTPTQIPVFPSSDFERTVAFYATLGFIEANRFGTNYLILEHPVGIELHFYGAGKVKSKANDHAVYIRFGSVEPVNSLYAEWDVVAESSGFAAVAGKAGRVLPPVDTDYGLREFALLDADGNLLRIGGALAPEGEVTSN